MMIDDAAPAGERSEVRGHRTKIGKSAALSVGGHTDPLWRSSLSIDARSVSATRWRRLLTTSPIPF
jgi:hypothetical protein